MKSSSVGWALSALLLLTGQTEAIRMPLWKTKRNVDANRASRFGKRTTNMVSGILGNGSQLIAPDDQNILYMTNITVGGSQFAVQIDTGSSDLWVRGDVLQTRNTSASGTIPYGSGSVFGFVNTATVQFDGYTVEDQIYLNAVNTTGVLPDQGILGLGPNSSSALRIFSGNSSGDTVLDRIFRQNMTTPNFLTVLLSRSNETGTNIDIAGQLTIGDVIEGLENITTQAKLPAEVNPTIQHWQTALDANGVIGPDGKMIQTSSFVKGSKNPDKLAVVFDTGATASAVPPFLVDAIYSRIPGAIFVDGLQSSNGSWLFPCTYEVNVTFLFNGVNYHIHPLDVSKVVSLEDNICFNSFGYGGDLLAEEKFDALLGDSFLRNVYSLFNFGDFVDGSGSNVAAPYIQLLPLTDPKQAHIDFVNARLGGVDTTGSQPPLLNHSSSNRIPFVPFFFGGNVTDDGNSTSSFFVGDGNKAFSAYAVRPDGSVDVSAWFIISIVLASLFVLLIVGMILASFIKRRRARRAAFKLQGASARPLWTGRGRSYDRLSNPEGRASSPVWDVEKSVPPSHEDHDDSELLPYPGDPGTLKYEEPKYQGGGL